MLILNELGTRFWAVPAATARGDGAISTPLASAMVRLEADVDRVTEEAPAASGVFDFGPFSRLRETTYN